MQHCTLAQARRYVARGSGQCDEDELTEIVNRIRREWFNWYAEIALFLDVVECYRVHRFCYDCADCRDSYRGLTLPRECQTVEAMWWNDFPMRLESSWREFQRGISPECDCRLQKIDLPGAFSTAADIRPNAPTRLRIVAHNSQDVGKIFTVRGWSAARAPHSESISLSVEPQLTEEPFSLVDHRGGVVKDVTVGRVVMAEEDGRVLGIYEPDETVPSYRRVKITGLMDDCDVVNVRCARRYFPLVGDNDVVETDNEPAFDAMARYLRLYRRSGKTTEEMKEEQLHLATARSHIMGDTARERGKATRAEVKIAVPHFGPTRLHRNFGGLRRGW